MDITALEQIAADIHAIGQDMNRLIRANLKIEVFRGLNVSRETF
jgi:hypothetical protein